MTQSTICTCFDSILYIKEGYIKHVVFIALSSDHIVTSKQLCVRNVLHQTYGRIYSTPIPLPYNIDLPRGLFRGYIMAV